MRLYIFVIPLIGLNQCNRHDNNFSLVVSGKLSFSKNPTDTWQIGYSSGNSLAFDQFQLSHFSDTSYIIGLWHPAEGAPGYYPYLGQNRASVAKLDVTGSWAARPGEIVMEGSNSGQYSILRFVAPATARYNINAVFEGIHFRLSSTDVHVLVNAKDVFSDFIDGYGGDSSFHPIEGTHPVTKYHDDVFLQKGDIITFAVGYGRNLNHFNDTNGLLLEINMIK
jgi:hypothetical protein